MSLDQWESQYRTGALATCPTAADGGIDLEVRQAWVEFFATLPDGACIVDIGTGNGLIPGIARESAAALGRHWTIHGTDPARIDPARDVADGARRFEGITFHAGVPAEKLPFETASVDAVTGHHALEYTDAPAALAEMFRVLKPGGDAQFIVHHADSVFMRSARASLGEADLVFKETKVFRRLHKLVEMEQVTPGTTERATTELRGAIQALKQALPGARAAGGGRVITVALDAVQKLLEARKQVPAAAAAREVERIEEELRGSTRRIHDLLAHGRDDAAMDQLQQQARDAGFTLVERLPQLHGGSTLVGWQLLMHRP